MHIHLYACTHAVRPYTETCRTLLHPKTKYEHSCAFKCVCVNALLCYEYIIKYLFYKGENLYSIYVYPDAYRLIIHSYFKSTHACKHKILMWLLKYVCNTIALPFIEYIN